MTTAKAKDVAFILEKINQIFSLGDNQITDLINSDEHRRDFNLMRVGLFETYTIVVGGPFFLAGDIRAISDE